MTTRFSWLTRRTATVAVVGIVAVILAACTAGHRSSNGSGGKSSSDVLTVVSGPSGPFIAGLNPFSTTDSAATMGVTSLVYEPLIMYNAIKADTPKPWLASAYHWSNGGRLLTFTIPSGRSWSDGTPLTAADVAFTFNLLLKDTALNVNGIEFAKASAPSATTATITFQSPSYTELFSISKVLIVPQHIWATIPKPDTYTNVKPIGSGPYLLGATNSQSITFTKNDHYWQAGLPAVKTVRVVDYTAQNAALNALSAGQIDWSTLFLANPQKQWTGKDPTHNKLWLAPAGDFYLCPNTAVKPLDNATVRNAISRSIDRSKTISQVEGNFYAPTTSPTGLRASQSQYMPAAYQDQQLTYDPAAARKMLESAGFTGGTTGTMTTPSGAPFKLTLLLPSEYTDWMSLGQLFVSQMKAAGIGATLQGVSTNAWTSDVANGQYDLTFCGLFTSDGPYSTFNTLLNSTLGAPVGKAAISNVSRWGDPATDAFLKTYRTTADTDSQTAAIQGLATIIANQAPIIPLMSVSSFGQYTTKRFTGFPGPDDPYQTDAIANPWTVDVILHLKQAS